MSKQSLRDHRGFSLVELMVSMAIGLVVTLAIFSVLSRSEGLKRTSMSINDTNQTGAYLSQLLDRTLRSAGSGFVQDWSLSLGCRIEAARNTTRILPAQTAFPEPFATVPQEMHLAPVLIGRGLAAGGSDVLSVMTGTAGFADVSTRIVSQLTTVNSVTMPNTLGLNGNDLVLMVEDGAPGCMLQQVQNGFTDRDAAGVPHQQLPFAGTYYSATGTGGLNLAAYGTYSGARVVPLGNVVRGNPPQFQLLGVGANDTLVAYDLLQTAGLQAPAPIAEGVVAMYARYGITTDGTPTELSVVNQWVEPPANTVVGADNFSMLALMDGSSGSQIRLRSILAVRVGLVLRSSLPQLRTEMGEGTDFESPEDVTVFGPDFGGALTRPIPDDQRKLRHRVVEFTVPLRNMLLLAN